MLPSNFYFLQHSNTIQVIPESNTVAAAVAAAPTSEAVTATPTSSAKPRNPVAIINPDSGEQVVMEHRPTPKVCLLGAGLFPDIPQGWNQKQRSLLIPNRGENRR